MALAARTTDDPCRRADRDRCIRDDFDFDDFDFFHFFQGIQAFVRTWRDFPFSETSRRPRGPQGSCYSYSNRE